MDIHYSLQLEYTQKNMDEKLRCLFLDVNP